MHRLVKAMRQIGQGQNVSVDFKAMAAVQGDIKVVAPLELKL